MTLSEQIAAARLGVLDAEDAYGAALRLSVEAERATLKARTPAARSHAAIAWHKALDHEEQAEAALRGIRSRLADLERMQRLQARAARLAGQPVQIALFGEEVSPS